ncbi:MAG: hypothetical protein KAS77_01640 [Thermoplasmata archaeon]|nr:hypothetical protein [Thermoplasmata archaeon]
MEGVSTVFLVVIILAAGGATGAYMAIEDFDLLDSGDSRGQDGGIREVGPRFSDVDTEECSFHDGECGNTGQDDVAACGTGQGCC